ncbi:glycoside hydrolase family 3 N-terminal domain-containing protein [Mangrovimonas sp. DI 80]|uniref:glycoside hydrolase family 3 N-terminal domain-containing protein n=1 Tax=Mangrovimonas sp. DI 80 TaxID=1779330 RepID=UPI000977FC9F|nr:glycoside hydrolase family 3 N-terminal domain-containing protein [Mangrovimonas sp. DI 80]OMP30790.1 beta-N-acetylglucosaminidase [Mangrovimonas sp. DI 80]
MKYIYSLTSIILLSCFYYPWAQSSPMQNNTSINPLLAENPVAQQKWVDSIYNGMTLEEKLGQLFMVQVFSSQDAKTREKIENLITEHHIGGIIYSKGGPVRQAKLNNELQALSKVPMLIGMDAEWGLSMRLDSTYAFPWNMTLGAIKDNALVQQTGYQVGEHCKRLGVHFNFAPVVDINTNPANPIIGNRSFGEDRDNVTVKALAFMRGMQSAGVLANAKHFPGHGDTEGDSHKTLPTIGFDEKRIDSIELYPYKRLIKEGLSSVMVAHLNVPSLEPRQGYPSSLSERIVTDILRERLQFQGLIFTDALEMKGVSNYSESGDVDLTAFLAGNDVLLMSEDVPAGVSKLGEAYAKGVISEERLSHSVKKILMAKYKVGLDHYVPIETEQLEEDLNRLKDDLLYSQLMESAITVVRNKQQVLPIRHLDTKKIAYVKFGDDDGSVFLNELQKYTKVHEVSADNLDELLTKLQNYNTVIIGLHKSNASPWKPYQFTNQELVWLYEIARTNNVILDVFVRPYALMDLQSIENIESIVVSYQNSKIAQEKSAQILFGALPAKGHLPVSAGEYFKVGDGVEYTDIELLGYGLPESVGMSSEKLRKLDSVANYAVYNEMTPGIQLLVARKGKVIYNKNFGKHTYEGDEVVKSNDIYDLASLTKILATLPLVMELEERGEISLNTKLSKILPEFKESNKRNITIKEMLSHCARLTPWIPFYTATLDSLKKPSPEYYRRKPSPKFNIKVADEVYLRYDYPDTMQKIIMESELLPKAGYRYSDMPYYILKKYIEGFYDQPLDELVQEHFYKALGANHTTYNPSKLFSNSQIVPTEVDDYYRYQTIQGYVHDMGAAMENGVGGHAGVFSNANDVAKIMQMYLQKGFYGGRRYLKPETIEKFNTCYYCDADNRRGVGFDKPQLGDSGPTCGCLSMTSFGHSGFTGTYAWADPEEEIVYVFLANRTYPTAGKNLLLRENIRTEIQRLIYEAIED